MLNIERFAVVQGIIASTALLTVPNDNEQWVLTDIQVSPSVGTAAWTVTLGAGGARVLEGTLALTDPRESTSWNGHLPVYPAESLFAVCAGGASIDVWVSGFVWPYPTPIFPLDTPY
jgi:hypothetical protein